MSRSVYHFGEYRLDPTARELWRADGLVTLPRRVFEGLVFLIRHRHRAVSHDELIQALWGHAHVTNARVSQLIMQVRRAVGDDRRTRRTVRTLSGFGYRWIMDTRETSEADDLATPAPHQAGDAIAVLPVALAHGEGGDMAWVRLGLMDLIAERLRDAGLTVAPSDSVVAALHVANDGQPDTQAAALRRTLNVDMLVQGKMHADGEAWAITLTAAATHGAGRRVACRDTQVMTLARQAADLLLATLGRQPPAAANDNPTLREWLQRVRAAVLADELDTARRALEQVPESVREDPELSYERARVAYKAGRTDAARREITRMLDDPAVIASPRLHARTLILRGRLENRAAGLTEWDEATHDFEAAVDALREDPWAAELGMALINRGVVRAFQRRFQEALRDLGQARVQFEVIGDQQGLAYVHCYMGVLEMNRKRIIEALEHYRKAAGISRAFGAVDRLRASLHGITGAHIYLLHWDQALESSEEARELVLRIEQPALRKLFDFRHAFVLISLGRHREAERILEPHRATAFEPPFSSYGRRALALLEWQRGDIPSALNIARKALETWPAGNRLYPEHRARLALLAQRASMALGRPRAAESFAKYRPTDTPEANVLAVNAVARAEWAASRRRRKQAAELFEDASTLAESEGIPNILAMVADARARWLLSVGEIAEAVALAGRLADWADQDFNSALLQVRVTHAAGQTEAWARALRQARQRAGERVIPAALSEPP